MNVFDILLAKINANHRCGGQLAVAHIDQTSAHLNPPVYGAAVRKQRLGFFILAIGANPGLRFLTWCQLLIEVVSFDRFPGTLGNLGAGKLQGKPGRRPAKIMFPSLQAYQSEGGRVGICLPFFPSSVEKRVERGNGLAAGEVFQFQMENQGIEIAGFRLGESRHQDSDFFSFDPQWSDFQFPDTGGLSEFELELVGQGEQGSFLIVVETDPGAFNTWIVAIDIREVFQGVQRLGLQAEDEHDQQGSGENAVGNEGEKEDGHGVGAGGGAFFCFGAGQ